MQSTIAAAGTVGQAFANSSLFTPVTVVVCVVAALGIIRLLTKKNNDS
jgi:hypothetical protein